MKKQQGLTLIEIMIALALGLFIIAATLTIYVNTIRSSSDTIKTVRLNHDLSMAMSLMSNDIKRAGFWGGAKAGVDGFANPFVSESAVAPAKFSNLQIRNAANPATVAVTGDCILYSYDADGDGRVDGETAATGDTDVDGKIDNEFYGFRLNLNNGIIEMRLSGAATNDCNVTADSWQPIGDNNAIEITKVKFSLIDMDSVTNAACANLTDTSCLSGVSRCLNYDTAAVTGTGTCSFAPVAPVTSVRVAQKRVVNIILEGQLRDDTVVRKSLTGTVVVRNDRLLKQ